MSIALGSDNYIKVADITKQTASGTTAPTSITSVTAELYQSDKSTAISDSEITLTVVSGDTESYEGTFADTLSISAVGEMWVKVTIIADTLTRVLWHKTESTRED